MAMQLWTDNGAYYSSAQLDKFFYEALRPECKFRQFTKAKSAVGKHKGDTFHWNTYGRLVTRGTVLTEGTAGTVMPKTTFPVIQGTMTITQYGNSVDYTEKLDDLSEHPVKEIITSQLKEDAKETFDNACFAAFNTTPLRVAPASGTSTTAITLTTNGTCTTTNNVALGKEHIRMIVETLKERNVPVYSGNDYHSLGRPFAFRQFRKDMETLHTYTPAGVQKIEDGEVGRFEGVRFFEQTNVAKGANFNTNSASDWVFFFGNDTVAEGVAAPEQIRGKTGADNFGLNPGIAWYYLGGFALNHATADQARVIKWDSAA